MNLNDPLDSPREYTEADWNPCTAEEAVLNDSPLMAYCVSKKYAEQAAWDFMQKENPVFDLVTFLPCIILGPDLNPLRSAGDLNRGNNAFIHSFINGTQQSTIGATFQFYAYIDVRDVAKAHVQCLEEPKASGQRIALCSYDSVTPQTVVNIINKHLPELASRVAKGDPKVLNPAGIIPETMSRVKARAILGWEFRGIEETIVDTVTQLVKVETTW